MQRMKVKNAFPRQEDGGQRIAISEKHIAHEGGELFIGDDKVYDVALTPGVKAALNDGRLVDVDEIEDEDESVDGDDDEEAIAKFADDHSKEELVTLAQERGLSTQGNKMELARAILAAE